MPSTNYIPSEKFENVIRQVLEASIGVFELKDFLIKVVKIGANALKAKSCSISMLVDDKGTLEILAASGSIGEKLMAAEATYYVPLRSPLTIRPNYVPIYTSLEDEKQLIENSLLGMGLTAFVVKTGEHIIYNGRHEFTQHAEHRGKYEKSQAEECQSIVMIPLSIKGGSTRKERAKADGVIKCENRLGGGGFGESDKDILSILAKCVSVAIHKLDVEEPRSYKNLFNGAKLLSVMSEWLTNNGDTLSVKHKDIMTCISQFSKDVLRWNIYGMERMYDRIISIIKIINTTLGFNRNGCIQVVEEITKKYEEILGTGLRYREHLVHQFQVFLLGLYIISCNEKIRAAMLNYLERCCITSTFDNILRCWFLSSIFHDFAYSMEKLDDWLGAYFQTLFSEELGKERLPFIFLWENLFTVEKYEYHKNMLMEAINRRVVSAEPSSQDTNLHHMFITTLMAKSDKKKKNHGLFGALVLMNKLMREPQEHDDRDVVPIVREAAVAIALHARDVYEDIYKMRETVIDGSPFAFLLVFCDNVQEWGRPWMKELEPGAIDLEDIGITESEVKVILKCDHKKVLNIVTLPVLRDLIHGIKCWDTSINGVSFHATYLNKKGGTVVEL